MTQAAETASPRDRLRREILEAALVHVPFDGWSHQTAREAAKDLNIAYAQVEQAFPYGPAEMAEAFFAMGDEAFAAEMATHSLDNMRIRDRIAYAVRQRMAQDEPHRDAARRALTLLALPGNAARGARALARTVDGIWRAVGDTSTDFNYYTKRATLAGVYSSTYLVWLGDHGHITEEAMEEAPETGAESLGEAHGEAWAFLDRRIEDVMRFEKAKGQVSSLIDRLPDPVGLAARLRYPGKRRFAARFPMSTEKASLNSR